MAYRYDRRAASRTAFQNPYAQHIKAAQELKKLFAEDAKASAEVFKAKEDASDLMMETLSDLSGALRKYPLADRSDHNYAVRAVTQAMRDAAESAAELDTHSSFFEDSLVEALRTISRFIENDEYDRGVKPDKNLVKALDAARKQLDKIKALIKKSWGVDPPDPDEIDHLFRVIYFDRPETEEEDEINKQLTTLKEAYEGRKRLTDRARNAILDSIIGTLKEGNPNQLQLL
jgi:hypothetical protein